RSELVLRQTLAILGKHCEFYHEVGKELLIIHEPRFGRGWRLVFRWLGGNRRSEKNHGEENSTESHQVLRRHAHFATREGSQTSHVLRCQGILTWQRGPGGDADRVPTRSARPEFERNRFRVGGSTPGICRRGASRGVSRGGSMRKP